MEIQREIRRLVLIGTVFLSGGFTTFLAWSALAPLDSGVPAPGRAIVESRTKSVSHLHGGIVAELYVEEAQYVTEGQPLLKLDDTELQAEYREKQKEYEALLAQRARLLAELRGAERIDFPVQLLAEDRPFALRQVERQKALFAARRDALKREIAFLQAQRETYLAEARAKAEQMQLLEEKMEAMRSLAAQDYLSRQELLDRQRELIDLKNSVEVAKRRAEEIRLQIRKVKEAFRKETEEALTQTEQRLALLEERLRRVEVELDRSTIRAPASGFVKGLQVHAIGAVIRPGEVIMEIVPAQERLLFEVQVPSHLIDKVEPGQPAEIQLQTMVGRSLKTVEGQVVAVSPDLIRPETPGSPPHYLAWVQLTPEGRKALGNLSLKPGMPATVLIKTGEQTLIQYVFKPLLRRIRQGLTEP